MEYIAITASLSSLIVSIISIVSVILKVNTSIIELRCSIENLTQMASKREEKQQDHEDRIRDLEIKSANCGCKTNK